MQTALINDSETQAQPIQAATDQPAEAPAGSDAAGALVPSVPSTAPTIDELKERARAIYYGELTAAEIKAQYARLIQHKAEVLAQLQKLTIKQLKEAGAGYFSRDKKDHVRSLWDRFTGAHVCGESISYSPFSGETYEDACTKLVQKLTEDQAQAYGAKNRAEQEAQQKACSDPQTLEEYRTFIYNRGAGALSSAQRAQFDELTAQAERARRDKETEQRARVAISSGTAEALGSLSIEVQKHYHGKRGHDVYIAVLSARIERDQYTELLTKARQLGGSWARQYGSQPAGFLFNTEEAARQFAGLKDGEASRAQSWAERRQDAEENAGARLVSMAEAMEEEANEKLNADRKTNTVRRCNIAEGVERDARRTLQQAATLRALGQAIQAGECANLRDIRHRTHVQTLEKLAQQANRAAAEAAGAMKGTHEQYEAWKRRPIQAEDIEHTRYPYPRLHPSELSDIIKAGAATQGALLAARRLNKVLKAWNEDRAKKERAGVPYIEVLTIRNPSNIEALEKIAQRASSNGATRYGKVAAIDALTDYRRVQAMKLETPAQLRAAIREYLQFRGAELAPDPIKAAERELIGLDIPGYYPTPAPLVYQMLELANIRAGALVLESSAGKGNIADKVRDLYAGTLAPRVICYEVAPRLIEVLKLKGHEVRPVDFLSEPAPDPEDAGALYDAAIINPPFENGAEIDHVKHTYAHLRPGAPLVAIMSTGPWYRSDQKAQQFRSWARSHGAQYIEVEAGAFRNAERATGVRVCLVYMEKEGTREPLREETQTEAQAEATRARLSSAIQEATAQQHEAERAADEEASEDAPAIQEGDEEAQEDPAGDDATEDAPSDQEEAPEEAPAATLGTDEDAGALVPDQHEEEAATIQEEAATPEAGPLDQPAPSSAINNLTQPQEATTMPEAKKEAPRPSTTAHSMYTNSAGEFVHTVTHQGAAMMPETKDEKTAAQLARVIYHGDRSARKQLVYWNGDTGTETVQETTAPDYVTPAYDPAPAFVTQQAQAPAAAQQEAQPIQEAAPIQEEAPAPLVPSSASEAQQEAPADPEDDDSRYAALVQLQPVPRPTIKAGVPVCRRTGKPLINPISRREALQIIGEKLGHYEIYNIAGPRNQETRRQILEALTGERWVRSGAHCNRIEEVLKAQLTRGDVCNAELYEALPFAIPAALQLEDVYEAQQRGEAPSDPEGPSDPGPGAGVPSSDDQAPAEAPADQPAPSCPQQPEDAPEAPAIEVHTIQAPAPSCQPAPVVLFSDPGPALGTTHEEPAHDPEAAEREAERLTTAAQMQRHEAQRATLDGDDTRAARWISWAQDSEEGAARWAERAERWAAEAEARAHAEDEAAAATEAKEEAARYIAAAEADRAEEQAARRDGNKKDAEYWAKVAERSEAAAARAIQTAEQYEREAHEAADKLAALLAPPSTPAPVALVPSSEERAADQAARDYEALNHQANSLPEAPAAAQAAPIQEEAPAPSCPLPSSADQEAQPIQEEAPADQPAGEAEKAARVAAMIPAAIEKMTAAARLVLAGPTLEVLNGARDVVKAERAALIAAGATVATIDEAERIARAEAHAAAAQEGDQEAPAYLTTWTRGQYAGALWSIDRTRGASYTGTAFAEIAAYNAPRDVIAILPNINPNEDPAARRYFTTEAPAATLDAGPLGTDQPAPSCHVCQDQEPAPACPACAPAIDEAEAQAGPYGFSGEMTPAEYEDAGAVAVVLAHEEEAQAQAATLDAGPLGTPAPSSDAYTGANVPENLPDQVLNYLEVIQVSTQHGGQAEPNSVNPAYWTLTSDKYGSVAVDPCDLLMSNGVPVAVSYAYMKDGEEYTVLQRRAEQKTGPGRNTHEISTAVLKATKDRYHGAIIHNGARYLLTFKPKASEKAARKDAEAQALKLQAMYQGAGASCDYAAIQEEAQAPARKPKAPKLSPAAQDLAQKLESWADKNGIDLAAILSGEISAAHGEILAAVIAGAPLQQATAAAQEEAPADQPQHEAPTAQHEAPSDPDGDDPGPGAGAPFEAPSDPAPAAIAAAIFSTHVIREDDAPAPSSVMTGRAAFEASQGRSWADPEDAPSDPGAGDLDTRIAAARAGIQEEQDKFMKVLEEMTPAPSCDPAPDPDDSGPADQPAVLQIPTVEMTRAQWEEVHTLDKHTTPQGLFLIGDEGELTQHVRIIDDPAPAPSAAAQDAYTGANVPENFTQPAPRAIKTRGLLCSIMVNKLDADCSSGSISAMYAQVLLTGPGVPEIIDARPGLPIVEYQELSTSFNSDPHPRAVPVFSVAGAAGPQFGGAFIWTSDSRFPSRQPIALHDRFEYTAPDPGPADPEPRGLSLRRFTEEFGDPSAVREFELHPGQEALINALEEGRPIKLSATYKGRSRPGAGAPRWYQVERTEGDQVYTDRYDARGLFLSTNDPEPSRAPRAMLPTQGPSIITPAYVAWKQQQSIAAMQHEAAAQLLTIEEAQGAQPEVLGRACDADAGARHKTWMRPSQAPAPRALSFSDADAATRRQPPQRPSTPAPQNGGYNYIPGDDTRPILFRPSHLIPPHDQQPPQQPIKLPERWAAEDDRRRRVDPTPAARAALQAMKGDKRAYLDQKTMDTAQAHLIDQAMQTPAIIATLGRLIQAAGPGHETTVQEAQALLSKLQAGELLKSLGQPAPSSDQATDQEAGE